MQQTTQHPTADPKQFIRINDELRKKEEGLIKQHDIALYMKRDCAEAAKVNEKLKEIRDQISFNDDMFKLALIHQSKFGEK